MGLAFDAQWKVSEDDPGPFEPVFDALELDKHRVYGVGAEITLPLATKQK